MHKQWARLTGIFFAAAAGWLPLQAQELGNSPYSRFGIGDLTQPGFTRQAGMAGAGVSAPTPFQINEINPALLPYTSLVTFELGLASQYKKIETLRNSQKDGDVSLRHLGLALPLNSRWTTAIGLRPFSSVNYQIVQNDTVTGDTTVKVRKLYAGNGGISEVFWMNGFRLFKGLTLGVGASYLFGNITSVSAARLIGLEGTEVVLQDRRHLNDFAFRGGLAYRTKLGGKLHGGIGATYQYLLDLNAERLLRYVGADTLSSEKEAELSLPNPLQVGISVDNGQLWTVAFDVTSQSWSNFRSFNGRNTNPFRNSYKAALGGEFTPDPSGSFFKRTTYRAGIAYGKTPLYLEGTQVDDRSVSVGLTLPMLYKPDKGSVYIVNLAVVGGTRGTTAHQLVKENYLRIDLGLSLTDRWFVRPKID